MKQGNRLLALLMALCLLASLAVMPAAAAGKSVAELEQELANAKAALEQAESDYNSAKSTLDNANKLMEEEKKAKSDAEQAQIDYDTAYAAAYSGQEGAPTQEQLEQLNQLKEFLDAKNTTLVSATGAANAVRDTIDGLKSAADNASAAKTEAQAEVTKLEKDLEDAKKAEEAPAAPTTPGSGDLSYGSSVDFGKLAKGSTSDLTRTFTISNRSGYDMSLTCSSLRNYTVSGAEGKLYAGTSTTVTVRLDSTSSTGKFNETLEVYASFVDGSGSYPMKVSISAEVVDASYSLSVSPSSKDLGKLQEGYDEKAAKELEITVTLENKGASSLQMNGVKGNDHFTVSAVKSESETLKTGEKTDYKIVPKKDMAVGTYTDTIVFQTREGATASFKATVAVEKKLDPLALSPNVVSFGTVEEGYTAIATQTVTVKNNTDRAILLTQPTSYSYDISPIPQSALAAGASTSFTIRPRTGLPANTYTGDIYISGGGEQAKLNVQFLVTRPAGPTTFTDVPSDSTFAADIAYVSQKGLMGGVGDGKFNPRAPITRGQLVTILYRLEGQPAVSGVGFSDVAAGSYCEKAVKWAAATGITTGGNDGLFRPNDSITREQLATFLYRYNRHKGYFTLAFADLSTFPDVGQVSSYAKDALSWANGAKLVNGTSDGRLNPSGGATRGQAAAILHRYCVSIGQ